MPALGLRLDQWTCVRSASRSVDLRLLCGNAIDSVYWETDELLKAAALFTLFFKGSALRRVCVAHASVCVAHAHISR